MVDRSTIHILYVSGLGDRYDRFRRRALRGWSIWGVHATLMPMTWADGGTFETKYATLQAEADRLRKAGKRVVLIGESAGGSVIMNALADTPEEYHRFVTICGKNWNARNVSPYLYGKNPAFKTSMRLADEKTDNIPATSLAHFISVCPLYDPVVPVSQMILKNGQVMRLFTVGHFVSIVLALTIYSPLIIRRILR